MEPLDPKLRQLIDEGLPAAMPDSSAEGRGLAALLTEIEAPPPVPPAAAPASAGLTKLVLLVAAAGAIGTAGWVATRPGPAPQPGSTVRAEAPEEAPKVAASPEPVPQPLAQPEPAPAPAVDPMLTPDRATPTRRPKPKRAAQPTPADALRAEADLIAHAESALDRNKPREALALCDMHRNGFDSPQLTTERKAIAASAACMLESTDTSAATAFVRAHPRSALATKVRQRCGLERSPSQ